MSRRPKALIIGGGIAGPVTAIFLKKAGIDAELFEAWPYSDRDRRRPADRAERHACAGRDRPGRRDDPPRIDRGILRFSFAIRRPARFRQPEHEAAFRPARGEHVPRHAERSADQQGLVRECRAAVREAAGRHRGSRRQACRRAFRRRLVCRRRFRDRRRWRAFRGARACDPGWPKTVRHRPDRLWRLRAAIGARRMRRSASAW